MTPCLKKYLCGWLATLVVLQSFGQTNTDTLVCISNLKKENRHHQLSTIILVNGSLYGGSMALLYSTWYKKYPRSSFHTFNDNKEWMQMDKMGHAFSAYTMSKCSREIWKEYGMNEQQSLLMGGLSGAFYQTTIEVLDGFSSQWGWSWGDIFSNAAGSSLYVGQELLWKEQRVQLKTSFHKKNYLDTELNYRSDELFGKSLPERLLKDYNGQSYWLSFNLKSFHKDSDIPHWLNIAFGTGTENMFGAKENISRNANGAIIFDRRQLSRFRQWYLAPDIDFTKIKTRRKGIKVGLFILNSLKFPTPSLLLENGKLKIRPISF